MVELSQRQQKNPPIGGGCHSTTFLYTEAFECLLAVTDGVWKYAGHEALVQAMFGPVDEAAMVLRAAVIARNGPELPDDFTVLAASKS